MLWQRQAAVQNLVPPTEPMSMSDEVRSWIDQVHSGIMEMLSQQELELGPEDGHALVDMI